MAQLWWLGLLLNVIGSWTINFGTNLVQYSHYHSRIQKSEIQLQAISSSSSRIYFWFGWTIFGFGNILNFWSLRFTAQVVLSALGSIQFITNILNIYILFKIPPTKVQIGGTILIVIGITSIISLSHLKTYDDLNYNESSDMLRTTEYIIYLIIICGLCVILELIYCYLNRFASGNACANDSHSTSMLSPNGFFKYSTKLILTKSILYSLVSTMIGSQSIIFAKSLSLLATRISFTNTLTYFYLGLWFMTVIFWIYRMNKALKQFKSLFIIPLLQVLWILFSIVNAIIFFKEMEAYKWYNFLGFIAGTLWVFIGVYFLAPPTERDDVDNLLTMSTWNIMFPALVE